jgi:trehalose 6-phosphate phosphatase
MQRRFSLAPLSHDCAVFLDIDGTLLNIAATPDDVIVPPGLHVLLHALAAAEGGALALVSGRALADIDRLFGRGLAAAAEHGAILRDATGRISRSIERDPALAGLAAPLRAAVAVRPGTLLEEKEFGLVLHWRTAPEWNSELTKIAESLAGPYPQLTLLSAHAALEIRQRGSDKASALSHFMRMPPFEGRMPVFVGDDLTDEPAIAWANAFGGRGLHVVRDFQNGVAGVHAWLETSLNQLKGRRDHVYSESGS